MIHLCRNIYLSADAFQYKVGTARKHHNKTEFRPITYHLTLPEALRSAANLALREGVASGEIASLQDAVTQMKRISDELKAAVSGMQ